MVFGVYNTNLFDSSRRNFCRRSLPQIDLGAGSLKRPTILPNHGPLQPADFRIRLEDSKCCTQGLGLTVYPFFLFHSPNPTWMTALTPGESPCDREMNPRQENS
jgi:hypothetical protein